MIEFQASPLGRQLAEGAGAGLAATLPMTIVMVLGHRLLPWVEQYPLPPRQIIENVTEKTGARRHLSSSERLAQLADDRRPPGVRTRAALPGREAQPARLVWKRGNICWR